MHKNNDLASVDDRKATNIRVYEDTKLDFEKCGKYGDSADSILKRLIGFYNRWKDKVREK
jgi:hypothetical protein